MEVKLYSCKQALFYFDLLDDLLEKEFLNHILIPIHIVSRQATEVW